jgi:hypothetical protein
MANNDYLLMDTQKGTIIDGNVLSNLTSGFLCRYFNIPMTYQQKHDELIVSVIDKWKIFQEADEEIFVTNEFGDINLKPNYRKAYAEWQQASDLANSFIAIFKKSGKRADSEI